VNYYDKDDVFEFYYGMHHAQHEIFELTDPNKPASVRALAENLIKKYSSEDDQLPPHASELALLLAANAHSFARDFARHYGPVDESLSFEELECIARGWKRL
jgi:hypothetical protein